MNYHESFQVQYPIKFFEATTENHVFYVFNSKDEVQSYQQF